MADIAFEDLFWQVRSELPGVPFPLIFLNYASAVREHLSRALAWQYNVPGLLDLAASTAFPTIVVGTDIPTGTYIVQPVRIKWLDGTDICFKTRDQLDDIDATWESRTGSSPSYWTITSPGTWALVPMLTDPTTDSLRVRVALAPLVTGSGTAATGVPEFLANEYQAAWANGALARLFKIPGKDWSNSALGSKYGADFENDIAKAKSRAAADYGRPHRTVQYGGLSIGGSGRRNTDDYGK